jgi:L-histidine Nalpha-methyltransferase / hercynylcysteine S-oxide synthase
LDVQISRILGNQTPPEYYGEIFERGIDPSIEDPSQCHAHSKVPNEWPAFEEIMVYKKKVHERIRGLVQKDVSKRLQRVLDICYEHEAMHIETLFYMFVQDCSVESHHLLPKPIWDLNHLKDGAVWVKVPNMVFQMGLNDSESGDFDLSEPTSFGWDNEKPEHQVYVPGFEIQHRPITIVEYFEFLKLNNFNSELIPESWTKSGQEWYIKTVYGLVELKYGYDWPVFPSNLQAQTYAEAKGMSLPTEQQLLAARKFNADDNGNHSFQHFAPTPVKAFSGSITDLVGNGWEWSRTIFAPFDGFEQSELYPGYSADFL